MPLPSVVNELCPEKPPQDSPLPAEPHARKTGVTENKKPGIKRRASPSAVSREGFTRSSTVAYPVFVSNLTSSLRERLPARRVLRAYPVFRHQTSIRIFDDSSSGTPTILEAFSVNFTTHVEIGAAPTSVLTDLATSVPSCFLMLSSDRVECVRERLPRIDIDSR